MLDTLTKLPEDLDAQLRSHLAAHGGGDPTEYVSKAVRRQMFWDTVDAIHKRNADVDPVVIEEEINQALDEVRANRR